MKDSTPTQLSWPQRVAVGIGIGILKLLGISLRLSLSPQAHKILYSQPQGSLFLLWHNRLALALLTLGRFSHSFPLTGLVSASKDGAILAEIMHAWNISTVRGSSSRRTRSATHEIIQVLRQKQNAVITPDGPRGPLYTVKEGTTTLAQDYAQNTYTVGLKVSSGWRMRSWDQFIIPHPFAIICVDIQPVTVFQAEAIRNQLVAMNG